MRLIETLESSITSRYKYNNEFLDDLIPRELLNSSLDANHSSKVIGDNCGNFASSRAKKIPFDEFSKDNGAYMKHKEPRKLYHLVIIGYGGFMINLIHFLEKIVKNEFPLFKSISIYEPDKLNTLNAVRIYQDLSKVPSPYGFKLDIVDRYTDLSINNPIDKNIRYFYEQGIKHEEENNDEVLYIGSPDFNTRKLLEGKNFLFFGHSGSDTLIHKAPVVEDSMAVETYGRMLVSDFYKGVLASAHQFLWLLANIDIDKIHPDTEIASYSAKTSESKLFQQDATHRRKYTKEDLLNDIQP